MGPLRVIIVLAGIFLVALGAGKVWNLKPAHGETDHTRVGRTAHLASPSGGEVWVALDRRDTYKLQQAMVRRDQAALDDAVARKTAFAVAAGAEVRVVGSNVSRREVEILEGPHTGMRGWVEFDLLQPERAYKRPIQPNPRRRY
jgi:hypothetical protein